MPIKYRLFLKNYQKLFKVNLGPSLNIAFELPSSVAFS